jgi:hypothetical protein
VRWRMPPIACRWRRRRACRDMVRPGRSRRCVRSPDAGCGRAARLAPGRDVRAGQAEILHQHIGPRQRQGGIALGLRFSTTESLLRPWMLNQTGWQSCARPSHGWGAFRRLHLITRRRDRPGRGANGPAIVAEFQI